MDELFECVSCGNEVTVEESYRVNDFERICKECVHEEMALEPEDDPESWRV